jgi:uncharacterized membrane-anchored protein YitT (DUF2179 family)
MDISFLLLFVSLPFLFLAWYSLSKRIFVKSILSIIALAIMIHFENFEPVTDDKLLIAIFGGLFLGAGIGLTVKNGAVLDGSEILGIFVNERYGISIGKEILVFNVILFSITAVLLSIEVAMYSILTFLITAKVIDLMIDGFEDFVGLMIVSNKSIEIERNLSAEISVGMTIYKSSGGFGKRGEQGEKQIIHTVINSKARILKRIGHNNYALITNYQPDKIYNIPNEKENKKYCGNNDNIYDMTNYDIIYIIYFMHYYIYS